MRIFVTGATGCIGGSIATGLLAQGHRVLGLARSEAAAAKLVDRGIEPVVGSLTDHGVLANAARAVDGVINAANSDNPFVVQAILPRLFGTGKFFVQVSGTSVVGAYDEGEPSEHEFHEDTPFTPMPEKATRVAIDRQVLGASLEGVRSVVVRPSLIYGRGMGVEGASVQIPMLIEQARMSGVGRHVGRGLNVWSHVHVQDVVELFLLVVAAAPAGSLFYVENGEASMKTAVEAISRMLGFGGKTEPWTIEDAVKALGPGAHLTFGSNSRVRSLKARKVLGWAPRGPGLIEEIEHGVYKEIYGR